MKASELRIGNYVWEDYGGDYVVTSIHNKSFETIGLTKPSFKTEGVYLVDEIKPILLTEEWLFKFGFSASKTKMLVDVYRIGEYQYMPKYEYFGFTGDTDNKGLIKSDVKYVHQLQNLYFALTGEELRIKE